MPKLAERALTAMTVAKLRPKADRYDTYDAALRGFGIRVSPRGRKTWFVMRRVDGEMIRATVGHYPEDGLQEARLKAEKLLSGMSAGKLPSDAKAENFEDVYREWMKRDQAKNRSRRTVESALDKHVLPRLKGKRIDAIRRKDILRILDGLVDAGAPIQANRVLAYLRRLFNWALERDLVTASPVTGIKPLTREKAADRVLSHDELRAVWLGADKLGYAFGPFIQLLILTGQRRDEVASMTWDEVDLDAGLWTIPGQRTKNGRPHLVHLSEPATEILDTLPRFTSDLVFTTNQQTPISGFSKAKKRLDRQCEVSGWTLHDLRRSFATHLTEALGFSPVVVDRILNHVAGSVKGVAAVYQRGEYLEQRIAALDAWGRFVTDESIDDVVVALKN